MTFPSIKRRSSGFTLIELLVVIGILAILLAITLIAINPNKHFQDARNAQRSSNVSAILDGIYEYESSNNGNIPPSLTNVASTAVPVAGQADVSASNTTFTTPDLTFTVPTGNTINSGSVTVSGCTNSGNNGTFPVTAGTDTTIVVTNASGVASDSTCSIGGWTGVANVCSDLVPDFLAALPMDPTTSTGTQCSGTFNTGYTIAKNNGRFTVSAPGAEGGATISVTR